MGSQEQQATWKMTLWAPRLNFAPVNTLVSDPLTSTSSCFSLLWLKLELFWRTCENTRYSSYLFIVVFLEKITIILTSKLISWKIMNMLVFLQTLTGWKCENANKVWRQSMKNKIFFTSYAHNEFLSWIFMNVLQCDLTFFLNIILHSAAQKIFFSARADMICPFWGHLILSSWLSCRELPTMKPSAYQLIPSNFTNGLIIQFVLSTNSRTSNYWVCNFIINTLPTAKQQFGSFLQL